MPSAGSALVHDQSGSYSSSGCAAAAEAGTAYSSGHHVDGVATFTRPGRVIVQSCGDARNVNNEAMARNLRYLRDHPDAGGRTVEAIGLDLWSGFEVDGVDDYVSYANFYIANGVVVFPTSGIGADDEAAHAALAAEFRDRQIVGVAGQVIAFGGGGPHCITMQIPTGSRPS